MPKVLDEGGFRLFFYADEGDEPPHVHVMQQGDEAKFWIRPVRLARNEGLSARDLNRARKIAELNEALIEEKWNEFRSRKS
jgi:hypothetical protein